MVSFRLSSLQWGQDVENARVRVLDLDKLGATSIKAYSTFSVERVYYLMLENDLPGIPVVDQQLNFLGMATQDKISKTVILKLIEKANRSEKK